MITKTVRGVIRNGKIETVEALDAPDGAEVVAHVYVPPPLEKVKLITFGMFSGPAEKMATEEDFQEARRSLWGKLDAD